MTNSCQGNVLYAFLGISSPCIYFRASDLEWLISEEEVPQALLPLPKSWPVNPDESENEFSTPLRGTTEWAPPRPQIIFTMHPMPW